MTKTVSNWQSALANVAHPEKIGILSSFFKTGPGEYGEGDIFIGVNVPDNRAVAKQFTEASLDDIALMLQSKTHEHRLSALLCLVEKYNNRKATTEEKNELVKFYLDHAECANNWDLVDLSAPKIIGEELRQGRCRDVIGDFVLSHCLWLRRIAMVSTLQPVMKDSYFDDALHMARTLLCDKQPLMNKAVGWILREVGKKNIDVLRAFMSEHIAQFSAITLSYATEKMGKEERENWRTLRKTHNK